MSKLLIRFLDYLYFMLMAHEAYRIAKISNSQRGYVVSMSLGVAECIVVCGLDRGAWAIHDAIRHYDDVTETQI